MTPSDWLGLFAQFLLLSLLTIGGYATVLPDAHRVLVTQRGLLDEAGFAQAVALGQVAPGPNILVIGMLGWTAAGWAGLAACLVGILLPSTLLVAAVSRWVRGHREHAALRAFQVGSAPLVLGLTLASGGLLALPFLHSAGAVLLLLAVAVGVALQPRWPPLGWLALGAAAGAAGWV
jgi:chromate transporter